MPRRLAPLVLGLFVALLVAAPAPAKLRYVPDTGVATVGKLPCRGKTACTVKAPKWAKARIGSERFWLKVLAPRRIAAGKKGTVRVKFRNRPLAALAGRTTTVKVRTVLLRKGTKAKGGRAKASGWKTRAAKKRRKSSRRPKAQVRWLKVRLRRAAVPVAPPVSGPLGTEPPLLARPATAVDVTNVQITWYPRDSWVRYIYTGQGMTFSGGASPVNSLESPCPDVPLPQSLPYTVNFTPRPSWFDPVSGVAGIYGSGGVQFRYATHGINFTSAEPEVEINGAASRLIFLLSGTEGTAMPTQRSPFLALEATGPPTVVGKTYSYSLVRGKLADDGTNVFARFYAPGVSFGCVSVAFTTP